MKSSRTAGRLAIACILAAAVAAEFGCQDAPTAPTAPTAPGVTAPIAGTINAPGDSAAPEIVFLAPLGPRSHPHGILDTTLAPSVIICRLNGAQCSDTVASFTSDSTTDSTLRVVSNDRAFHVRWHIADVTPDTAAAYRVTVALGDTTVGYSDLKIVPVGFRPDPADTLDFAFVAARRWLRIRFQIFVPPVTLTVISEPGVTGTLASGTYSVRSGSRMQYSFRADSGYQNALVTVDQQLVARHGRVRMDESHVLIASADRATGVAPGDEWILRDARAMLRSHDKVSAAQQLLDKLDAMPDTANITERLKRVEMTLLARDGADEQMRALDAALDGHTFSVGDGLVDRGDDPPPGGGGGGGGSPPVASARMAPIGATASLRPAASAAGPAFEGSEPVTIAYVNGILTTPLGALFAAHHVALLARSAPWHADVSFDVKLIYNRSAMAERATREDRCVLDLGIKGDWLGLNSLPDEVAKCLNSTRPKALAMLADYAEAGTEFVDVLHRSLGNRPSDADTVAAVTKRLRDAGRHVVFVMHSQGNLIVQQALLLLRKRGQYTQATDTTCIGGVALASPTSKAWPIAKRHLHGLAVQGDVILLLGENDFPRVRTPLSDSAAAATTGSVRKRIMGIATAAAIRWGVRLHAAVTSYLTPEPIRTKVQEAIVAAYRSCALGAIKVVPQQMQLRTDESGTFHYSLLDLDGEPLDGTRGVRWTADAHQDSQLAVNLSSSGTAVARYVGGTSVVAATRNDFARGGVVVDPAVLKVAPTEALSARWIVIFLTQPQDNPEAPFMIPATGWDGGDCTQKLQLTNNGHTGTMSKQCKGEYHAKTTPYPRAKLYQAAFFELDGTAALFVKTGPNPDIQGVIAGPQATLEPLPGPKVLDRIVMTAYDGSGHLLARGVGCVHGCRGWPPE